MSPTIVREQGFRVVIYTHDHQPPHVHVQKAGEEVRVFLSPVALWDGDMKPRETRKAVAIVEANRDTLLVRWYEIHGED